MKKTPHTEKALDPSALQVRFSETVRDIYHDLAEIARTSAHFDNQTFEILDAWSKDRPISLHTVMTALPFIAEQMAEHAKATNDQTVMDIWRALCTQLPEDGYAVSESRAKVR